MSAGAGPAHGGVPDLVAPGLRLLFCGINPGLASAARGLHFARAGNRFWRVLHLARFTPTLLAPDDQHQLLALGIGITNLAARPSAAASSLSPAELRAGAARLTDQVASLAPEHVAVLGVLAYRTAFGRRRAGVGRQAESIAGSALWVLPNPSGLQASYQLGAMVDLYGELALAAGFPLR